MSKSDTIKVFVSSTYDDLQEHRRAVDAILTRLSMQFHGMEYFGSRPFEPKRVCFDEISQCQIFVGIYAHRYGWVPSSDRLSITEQEFDFAVNHGLKCYCYIVDSNYEWSPRFIEHERFGELTHFKKKIDRFVRSFFTSPDNLAKQVAADINLINRQLTKNLEQKNLAEELYYHCLREIETTIGPKYIKDLYVDRNFQSEIRNKLEASQRIDRIVDSLKVDCQELCDILSHALERESVKRARENKKDSKKQKYRTELIKATRTLRRACQVLEGFPTLPKTSTERFYPAMELAKVFTSLEDDYLKKERWGAESLLPELNKRWVLLDENISSQINTLRVTMRPVFLMIDRAGSGKTNFLCNMVEVFGGEYLCFFMAAKSIYEASENAILRYLTSVYPYGDDPIDEALEAALEEDKSVLVIVDGINENLNPKEFNTAIKFLVRRYYGRPIKFVISCRDIYWNYFEDEWWLSHCTHISRDQLYRFSAKEFRRAMPLYLKAYNIKAEPTGRAREQLHHPLLLRFYCEAFKGTADRPQIIGIVEDIRLLELFDKYCQTKFKQIQKRLNLMSSDEVYHYLELIAHMMLKRHSRLLSVKSIAEEVRKAYGETTIRTVNSRYVQILDEDIMLEERPAGVSMNIKTGFVYDEFMEYVMARALVSDLLLLSSRNRFNQIQVKITELFKFEKQFISVIGVAIYIGEMLAKVSKKDGIKYVDWLTSQGKESMACQLIARWPAETMEETVFLKLCSLHKAGHSNSTRMEAWRVMVQLSLRFWNSFFDYIIRMPLKGTFRPMNVFSVLARVGGGVSAKQRLDTIKWIEKTMRKQEYMIVDVSSNDLRAGIAAIKRIIDRGKSIMKQEQIEYAENVLQSYESILKSTKHKAKAAC